MSPLSSGAIEIIEVDHGGTKIDLKISTKLGPNEYGAKLMAPNPQRPVSVIVDDSSATFAATTLGHLNSKVHARLDVAVYPLPSSPGGSGHGGGAAFGYASPSGGGPQTPDEIERHIQQQLAAGNWRPREAFGVRTLLETVLWALGRRDAFDAALQRRLDRWLKQLEALGILIDEVRSQKQQTKRRMGEGPQAMYLT
jgi:hypothetical protein